jgi:hypothetical protein
MFSHEVLTTTQILTGKQVPVEKDSLSCEKELFQKFLTPLSTEKSKLISKEYQLLDPNLDLSINEKILDIIFGGN